MKTCAQQREVVQAMRAGHWPHGVSSDLREHVASCSQCADEACLLFAFAMARENAMRATPSQSAGLLWWKAQLRRRQETMERLERPGRAIPAITISASVLLLTAVLITAWKRLDWSRLITQFTSGSSNAWILAVVAAALCGFAVATVLFISSENRS